MNWWRRQLSLLSPEQETDAAINDCLLDLHCLLLEAETQGHHFMPNAKLARKMMQAINWR